VRETSTCAERVLFLDLIKQWPKRLLWFMVFSTTGRRKNDGQKKREKVKGEWKIPARSYTYLYEKVCCRQVNFPLLWRKEALKVGFLLHIYSLHDEQTRLSMFFNVNRNPKPPFPALTTFKFVLQKKSFPLGSPWAEIWPDENWPKRAFKVGSTGELTSCWWGTGRAPPIRVCQSWW